MKAIIANAVEAASADMSWKAIDRYSKDYAELQTKDKVKFYRTPDSVLQKQAPGIRHGRGEEVGREPRCSRRSSNPSASSPEAGGEVGPGQPTFPPHASTTTSEGAGGRGASREET